MRKDQIVLRAGSMEKVWQKWHESNVDGGHPGIRSMELRIKQAYYYYGDLRAWLVARKLKCSHCQSLVVPSLAKPPPATLSSKRPYYWMVLDHTEVGHTDALTGATYDHSTCCMV